MRPLIRTLALALVALAGTVASAPALQDSDSIDLEPFRAPSSPAFSLLGVAPTNIDRPAAPKEFFASLVSSLDGGSRDVPTDVAIEFSPYWWFDHEDLTYEDFISPEKSIWKTALQTFSVSLATTEIPERDSAPMVDGTRLGLGIRFQLLDGTVPRQLSEAMEDQRNSSRDLATHGQANEIAQLRARQEKALLIDGLREMLAARDSLLEQDSSDARAELNELDQAILETTTELAVLGVDTDNLDDAFVQAEEDIRSAGAALRAAEKERYGWTLEMASAAAADFVDGDAGDGEFTRTAGWATLGYTPKETDEQGRPKAGDFTFLGVARYMWDDIDDQDEQFIDLGARAIWRATDSLDLSAEILFRDAGDEDETERWAAVAEYQVSDDYAIIASFGSDFDTAFEGDSDLIASIGFSVGIGGPSTDDFR